MSRILAKLKRLKTNTNWLENQSVASRTQFREAIAFFMVNYKYIPFQLNHCPLLFVKYSNAVFCFRLKPQMVLWNYKR